MITRCKHGTVSLNFGNGCLRWHILFLLTISGETSGAIPLLWSLCCYLVCIAVMNANISSLKSFWVICCLDFSIIIRFFSSVTLDDFNERSCFVSHDSIADRALDNNENLSDSSFVTNRSIGNALIIIIVSMNSACILLFRSLICFITENIRSICHSLHILISPLLHCIRILAGELFQS